MPLVNQIVRFSATVRLCAALGVMLLTITACGTSSGQPTQATSSTAPGTTEAHNGCLVTGGCASGSAACRTAEKAIQQAFARTAQPTVELVAHASATTGQPLTKAQVAHDRAVIQGVIDQVSALRATYLKCPGHDQNLAADLAALRSDLR